MILVLNDKHQIVSREHLMYGVGNLERYRAQMVCSIEKNRGGQAEIDLEFAKHLDQSLFDPRGAIVAEDLVDDRIHVE